MFNNPMQPYPMPGMDRYTVGMNWVNGATEVDSVELPPGANAVFFDKANDGIMYIRSRDRFSIYSPTRVFKIEEIVPKVSENSEYVTRSELEELFQRFLGGTVQNDALRTDDGAADPEPARYAATVSEPMVGQPASATYNEPKPASGTKRKADGTNPPGGKRS